MRRPEKALACSDALYGFKCWGLSGSPKLWPKNREALNVHFANVYFWFLGLGGSPFGGVRTRVVFSGDCPGRVFLSVARGPFKGIRRVRGAPRGTKNQSGHVKSGL